MTNHAVDQLQRYRKMQARITILSSYSVGSGITISRLNQEDQLQELHSKLRGMPSYMYLSKHEQKLETVAHAYLERYPAGVKSQLRAIPEHGADQEDNKLLKELREKISRVVEARGGQPRGGIDSILDRLAELQDLQAEIERIDQVLDALEAYKPEYAKVLRLLYIDGKSSQHALEECMVSRTTFYDLKRKAEAEYIFLAQ